MKRKMYSVATAILATGLMAGVASAGGDVANSITSEPIGADATCGKAGAFTFEFEAGSTLTVGDRITIDLPISGNESVTLCKDIDMIVAPGAETDDREYATGETTDRDGIFDADVLASPELFQANGNYTADASPVVVDGFSGAPFAFYVHGSGTRIYVDVLGATDDAVATLDDGLVFNFFDEANYADGVGTEYIWLPGDNEDDDDDKTRPYTVSAGSADNAICIDVSNWSDSTVNAHLDSRDDLFVFTPNSDPVIAHTAAAASFAVELQKDYDLQDITLGEATQSQSEVCGGIVGYDNKTDDYDNRHVIVSTDPFDQGSYAVELTIMVGDDLNAAKEGDNGVYFAAGDAVEYTTYKKDDLETAVTTAGTFDSTTYYTAGGDKAKDMVSIADCAELDDDGKAVRLVTSYDKIITTDNVEAIVIDIPDLVYSSDFQAGDNVTVKVEFLKAPCGAISEYDKALVGTAMDKTTATATTLTFPYFTEADGDVFWDGLAIVNMDDEEQEVTITLHEVDGDVATATVTLQPAEMFVDTLYNLVMNGDFVLVANDAEGADNVLGNARSYVTVSGQNLDGFAMIGDNDTGVSMGYLPRD